jgi:hypothetical protein
MHLLLLLAPLTLLAQAPPSCDAPEYRQFDFWVGEWRVTSASKLVGRSVITNELGGCLLIENWYGVDGDRGKSLNWYEPSTKKWRQVYVGLNWNIDYTGEWLDGALRFESATPARLTFTPMPDNQVRQHKESLQGEKWVTLYDFQYKRESVPPEESSSKPGCTTQQFGQFDFWVGEWKVYNPARQLAGTNRIEKVVNGCLLFENWIGAKGGAGKSFNFYDTARRKWRQVWVSAGSSLDLQGDFIDGAIRYTGETPGLNGATQESLTFTPNSDGTVRQLWQQSPDGGNTWRVVFDGQYVRDSYRKTRP